MGRTAPDARPVAKIECGNCDLGRLVTGATVTPSADGSSFTLSARHPNADPTEDVCTFTDLYRAAA